MAAKVAVRVFHIELIICGFLVCVLVARNLCMSENGTPISCPGSRHGNATGTGAGEGASSSGGKVKVLGEGEVLNMGAKRNAKTGKKFRPLFLVSKKDRSRSTPPKASKGGTEVDDKEPRLLKVEKDVPGKNAVEPQGPNAGLVEKSEVMQSRGQLPEEEQGVFEFLDMFGVSDWLSNRRRQKGDAASRLEGSKEREVDSKEQWLVASKGAEEDDEEAEDSSKMKEGQRAASKDEPERSKKREVDSKKQWLVASKEAEQDDDEEAEDSSKMKEVQRAASKGEPESSKKKEVASKKHWLVASKEVEQNDEEAKDSSKGERAAASKDEQVSSDGEVLRSIISKAKPVRIKATIVAKSFLPRARLLRGSRSKVVVGDAEDEVTSTLGAVDSEAEPLTDRRPRTIGNSISLAAFDVPHTGLNGTNASSRVPTGKDPSASKPRTSILDKEDSNALGFANDDTGLFANIFDAIFQDEEEDEEEEDSIETPGELAFDEVDVLEAAKRDADELIDRLDVVSIGDPEYATMSRDESTVVKQLAELNEKLSAVNAEERSNFEDENRSDIDESQAGDDEDISTAVENVPKEPAESYNNASEGSADISTRLAVSLNQGQHRFTDVLGAKDGSQTHEDDASDISRNNTHYAVNETEETFPEVGKKIQNNSLLKSEDNDSSKRKDFQLQATDVLVTAKNIAENRVDVPVTGKIILVKGSIMPVKVEIMPAKGEITPVNGKIIPSKGEIMPVKGEIIPVKGEYIIPMLAKDVRTHANATAVKGNDMTVQATDTPSTTEKSILNKADDGLPLDMRDILAKVLDIRSVVEDTPVYHANALPSTAEANTVEQKRGVAETVTEKPAKQEGIVGTQDDLSNKANDMNAKAEVNGTKPEDLSKKVKETPATEEDNLVKQVDLSKKAEDIRAKAEVKATKREDLSKKVDDVSEKAKSIGIKPEDLSKKADDMPAKSKDIATKQDDLSKKANDMVKKAKDTGIKQEDLSKKAKEMPATEVGIPTKQDDLSKNAKDMPEKAEIKAAKDGDLSKKASDTVQKAQFIASKQDDLSKKEKEMPATEVGILVKQENLTKKEKEMPTTEEVILVKQIDLSKKAKEIPEKAENKATKQGNLPKKSDDSRSKSESKATKHKDLSKNTDDMPPKPEDTTEQVEPESKQLQDDESTKPGNASVSTNDTSDEDNKSSALDKEEVKLAMFTEMGNIMSDLNYLGTLWEQLKPGMKLKNTDAVRKVLHAVSHVFGLENKDIVVSQGPSSRGLSDRGRTAAERLRYDLKVQQRSKNNGGQGQKGFKNVSYRNGPSRGQKKRVGLRSRRSLQGTNRRRVVQVVGDRRNRRSRRNRHGDSEGGRKLHKRRSGGRLAREDGEEEEDIVVEEDWSNKNLNEGRVRKRTGYEDYIFGNNPGYILSRRRRRRRRDVPPGGPVAPAATMEDIAKNRVEDNAEDRAEDRAEEDAISRELANLLIEKVYNRVMKSLKTPKLENEAAQTSPVKPSEMQRDDEDVELKEERRKRNFRSDGIDIKRSKRNVDNVDMDSYCSMLRRERYNVTDENGEVTDLYRQAVNNGMCTDFHMAVFAEARAEEAAEEAAQREAELEVQREREREAVERRNSKTFEGDAVGREQGQLEKELGKRGTVLEADGGMEERAVEGAKREVENEGEMVVGREAEGEGKELAEEEESRREDSNEVEEEVVEREVKPNVRGARQREAQVEVNKREMNDELEGLVDRKVRMEVDEEARQVQAGNEVEREANEETENEEEEESEEEVGNEVMVDTGEESEESEEKEEMAVREAGDEAVEELNGSARDVWDFASKEGDHQRGGATIDKRSVSENVNRRAKKTKKDRLEKSRRWSNAEGEQAKSVEKTDKNTEEAEKTEAETDKSVDEFITYLDPIVKAAGKGKGKGQGQGQ